MVEKAHQLLEGAAKMYDLGLEVKPAASSLSGRNSPEMIELATRVAGSLPGAKVVQQVDFGGSEDVTMMMERVQSKGGKALFAVLVTPSHGGHDLPSVDLEERVRQVGVEFCAAIYHGVPD